jgi:2-phosphosulfolactate phosphatase
LAAAHTGTVVLTACLRNAVAVARYAATIGTTFNVIPAGERWPDGSIRFAIEDFIGAGAVLLALPGRKAPEASASVAAFEQFRDRLHELLADSMSGRELIEAGFPGDVKCAGEIDVSSTVPRLDDGRFRNAASRPQTTR